MAGEPATYTTKIKERNLNMSKKIEHAASVLREIKSEVIDGVIKDCEMPTLCNMETSKETGFAVILTLSTRYDYTSVILDDWRNRLEASDYMITVKRNQLRVRFNVMYGKKKYNMNENVTNIRGEKR